VSVRSEAFLQVLDWENFAAATYTNDIIIENNQNPDVPVMQFSFPDFINEDGLPPSEAGCLVDFKYVPRMAGTEKTTEVSIVQCRERCENTPGCTKFTYYANKKCFLADDSGVMEEKPANRARSVSGPVGKCGHPAKWNARAGTEINKAKLLKNGTGNKDSSAQYGTDCPALYYQDGVLQDISELQDNDFLYGSPDSDHYAQLQGNQIHVVQTTADGSLSEIMLEVEGTGPGETWGCHWNLFVCLPETEKDKFSEAGLGLMGTPDGDTQNDWMDTNGNTISLPNDLRDQAAYDYCKDNWCVSQADSNMIYPVGASYDDVKCVDEEYVDFEVNDSCVLSSDEIFDFCADKPPLLLHACYVECCYGGCEAVEVIEEVITNLLTHTVVDEEIDLVYEPVMAVPFCQNNDFVSTGETKCKSSSESIVEVIYQSALEMPEEQPVIYGIGFGDREGSFDGRQVKFLVNNPYDGIADTFVRYGKKVGISANDPVCDSNPDLPGLCQWSAPQFTVGCVERPGTEPFAVVDIYFVTTDAHATNNADSNTEVEKCCEPPQYTFGEATIQYSVKIQCSCPDGEATEA